MKEGVRSENFFMLSHPYWGSAFSRDIEPNQQCTVYFLWEPKRNFGGGGGKPVATLIYILYSGAMGNQARKIKTALATGTNTRLATSEWR